MKVEQIIKVEKIRTKKKISVASIAILCSYMLFQWCRIDNIFCQIFLYLVTIGLCYIVAYLMNAHYDDKIDKFYAEEVNEFIKAGE